MRHNFSDFLKRGGFPEVVNYHEDLLLRSLREYLDMVIYRDIVERHGVTNLFVIKYLMNHLIRNMGNLVSPGKLFNDLKSQGLKISKNTVYQYIGYMEEAFALYFMPIWTLLCVKSGEIPRRCTSLIIA